MRKKYGQMSILDTCKSMEEHQNWEEIIPAKFSGAFYRRLGRRRGYGLESFLRMLFLQRIFHCVEGS